MVLGVNHESSIGNKRLHSDGTITIYHYWSTVCTIPVLQFSVRYFAACHSKIAVSIGRLVLPPGSWLLATGSLGALTQLVTISTWTQPVSQPVSQHSLLFVYTLVSISTWTQLASQPSRQYSLLAVQYFSPPLAHILLLPASTCQAFLWMQ